MKFAVMALLAGSASAYATIEPYEYEFMSYISKYGKSYGTKEEYNFRLAIFKETFEGIEKLNSEQSSSVHGINKFADLTDHEMQSYFGLKVITDEEPKKAAPPLKDRPLSIDWKDAGHVTGVKNQLQCGSCWTFTVAGACESADSVAGWGLNVYSEQQLLDCDRFKQDGCTGGFQNWGLEYVKLHGLKYNSEYGYTGTQVDCPFPGGFIGHSHLDSFLFLEKTKDATLNAVADAPVSVAVSASTLAFKTYQGGILSGTACSEKIINHGILATGYSCSETDPSDCVLDGKNSWGTDWGEDGYIRLASDGQYGTCNWAQQSFSATSKPKPTEQETQ